MKLPLSTFRSLSALALMACSSSLYAYKVTGTIADPSGEGCVNAVYHIYAATDTVHPLLNAITDEQGQFSQPLTRAGEYLLQAEYVGLQSVTLPFSLTDKAPEVNLGTLTLSPSNTELSEVVVTGKRPMIVSDGANLEYNVQADPTASTSTILELLRKVPMVTVDGEDNIRVNGTTDFKIYVNGKPNPMFESEPQRVLKNVPASTISRIEVLTEPGAKYDAEGVGGILNIVTETGSSQQVADGYAGSIGLEASIENVAANAFLRGKYKKVSGSATVVYAHGGLIKREALSSSEIEYLEDETNHRLSTEMTQESGNPFDYAQGNAAISWEPNEKNLFGVTVSVSDIKGNQDMTGFNEMFDASGKSLWRESRELYAHFSRLSVTTDASYQHFFRGADHSLTASFQLSHGNQQIKANTLEQKVWTNNVMDTKTNEYTLQLDWHNRLNDHNTVEAGAKGVLSDNRNDSFTTVESLTQDGVEMKQHRNLGALYGAYIGSFGKFTSNLGLRYEYTDMGVDFITEGYRNFNTYLNDIVPNASLSWSFTPISTLRLAYNMRISRPDINQLNPYQWSIMTNEIRMGNPDLSSQRSNNLSLGFSSFTGKVQFNVRAEYQNVNNLISEFQYVDSEVIYHTYMNSGTQQKGILSAYANWYITPMLMLSVNGAVEYTDFNVKNLDLKRHGWSGNAGGNLSWTLPEKISISAYGGWSGLTPTLQGSRGGWSYYGLGVSKSLLKDDALKLTLGAQNMFTNWMHFTSRAETATTVETSKFSRHNWNVSVSAQWNFGHLNQNIRTVEKKIDNNDKVATDSGSGNGIL